MATAAGLTCRWLGVAGLEINWGGQTLLVDPFFTRPGLSRLVTASRLVPNQAEIARHITRADFVLVTHSHYDHLMDVPEVLRQTGARAFGSPNTRALLALHGHACQLVQPGDHLSIGPFQVEVYPARHTPIPLSRWLNGPLPANFAARARLPLRPTQYRMDACYSYRIHMPHEPALLVGNHPAPAGVLFIAPYHPASYLQEVLPVIQPRVVVPIHWDDFTRPLSQPLRRMRITRAQGLARAFPPIQPVDLEAFTALVRATLPDTQVHIPQLFTHMNF